MQILQNLSVRAQVVFLIFAVAVIIMITVYTVTTQILLGSYQQIERDTMQQNVERADDAILDSVAHQNTTLKDWAHWTDTYRFATGENPEYIADNLTEDVLKNLGLNIFIIVDEHGAILYSKVIDSDGKEIPGEEINAALTKQEKLTQHTDLNEVISGILSLQNGLLLVGSSPILTSENEGPSAGSLIFGKFLDTEKISEIGMLTHLSVSISDLNDSFLPDDIKVAKANLNDATQFFVAPLSHNRVGSYTALRDIYNRVVAIIRVDSSRTIYNQGQQTYTLFVLIVGLSILIEGLLIILVLEKILIHRFARLSNEVTTISHTRDLNTRVTEGKPDEIGKLATSINALLAELSQAEVTEQKLQQLEEDALTQLREHVSETEKFNKSMVGRELKMIELKDKIERLEDQIRNTGLTPLE